MNMVRWFLLGTRNIRGEEITFQNTKQSRRKGREESDLDWDDIFGTLNKIRNEIKENFPYKYLEVFGAEADDIIGFLCEENKDEKIMIISGDKDFIQLQKYPNVKQWSPITKKMSMVSILLHI